MASSLVIRADANIRMGTGHVMRCIALAQAWQDVGGEVLFVCCCDSSSLKQRIVDEGFHLIELSAAYPANRDDLSVTQDLAKKNGARWIVTDGYHFDLTYQKSIREAGFHLLYVDDCQHLPQYEADILLNQNFEAEQLAYRCNEKCSKKLGIRYVMLRREFRKAARRDAGFRSPVVKNILITMGGSDPENASLEVLHAVVLLGLDELYIKVLLGPSNPHIESIRSAVASLNINGEVLTDVLDMPGLMDWADLCLTAAGSTCWELAALDVPFVTVIIAENQERIALRLKAVADVPSVGWVGQGFLNRCVQVLSETIAGSFPSESPGRISSLIDCFGVDRILSQVAAESGLDLLRGRFHLRPVQMDDAKRLLEWANDPLTRKSSFHSQPIDLSGHIRWLTTRLADDRTLMYILELDQTPCGHIRYERDQDDEALLSFVVAPDFRGMGIGKRLVELGCKVTFSQWDVCRIKAYTLKDNRPSARIFEETGFTQHLVDPIGGKTCNLYILETRES